jgi:hypothetical protein
MAFWSKTTAPANPRSDDDGLKINQRAAVLQEIAAKGLTGASETLAALANALGNEAAVVVMRHPNVQGSSSLQHVTKALDGMLDLLNGQVREFAYIKATGNSPSEQSEAPSDNPFRAFDPVAFDKGEKINRKAGELQRIAAKGLPEDHAVTALQTALGNEITALVARRNPTSSADQKRQVIDETIDVVCPGVREAAYIAANLPAPTEGQDVDALTNRIITEATKNDRPVHDALFATAKALGAMIAILSERPDYSFEELIKSGQIAVAECAREALAFHRSQKG